MKGSFPNAAAYRKEYMTNYKVGDTVEALDSKGIVEDTGVVTKIEESYEVGVYKIWVMWEIDGELLHSSSNYANFRIKTKHSAPQEISLETVSKVLEQYFDSNPAAVDKTIGKHVLITRVFYALQAKYEAEQKKHDPEYQKYLELKKKFEDS